MRASTLLVLCVACGGEHKTVATKPATTAVASVNPSATASACLETPKPPGSYEPQTAWSGRAANIPEPPTLPTTPLRVGDAYTVYGAIRTLHALDGSEKLAHDITIVGWIVDTNLARAPKCAIHHTGHADPANCTSEVPAFTIADEKTAAANAPRIRVMGWASNFPNVYEAYLKERAHSHDKLLDENWARELPSPLPAATAKVKVTGRYGMVFSLASSGIDADPRNGIFTVTHTETLEPATTPAAFPQLGR